MFYVVCTKVFIIGFYFTCRYDLYMLLLIQLFYSCSKQGLGALTTVSNAKITTKLITIWNITPDAWTILL